MNGRCRTALPRGLPLGHPSAAHNQRWLMRRRMVNMLESVVRNNMYRSVDHTRDQLPIGPPCDNGPDSHPARLRSLNSGWLDGLEWEKYVVEQYEVCRAALSERRPG
jgi:hypothetical protein